MESGLTHLDILSQHMGRRTEEYQTRVSIRIDGCHYGYHANKVGELSLLEIHLHNIFKYFYCCVSTVNYILLLCAENNNCTCN
jgi:hypothetical protein